MRRYEYRSQRERPNPRKPSVCRGPYYGWQVRGYDEHFLFHTTNRDTWDEAVELAIEWARDGYPEVLGEVAA